MPREARVRLPHASVPEWNEYRVLGQIKMTSQVAQTLTGHRGFVQYLFRFKLRDSPYCACDPAKFQNVLYVFKDCDVFQQERVALGTGTDVRIVDGTSGKI
ncbi:hypothetical protein EVAR_77130_1 [Eumeta japonica]|uniref:Uncharacterized protein n=1 Tax=Eumeta variegata TaxID=151549 RepID=A0A4C1T4N7_EUMVA|nr:hypothetical protein EVAR_77130_1 [Eumeta japonica]